LFARHLPGSKGLAPRWLLNFVEQLYLTAPEDLQLVEPIAAEIEIFCLEADELWSFVAKRENKRWIWLILERRTRQIIAPSDRRPESRFGTCFMGESPFADQSAGIGAN